MALRAFLRLRGIEAAMMADELAPEAVIDQPGVAVRTIEPEAAGAAQRERRIAATIEEQQGLLTAFQRRLHRTGKTRRDEASARRAFAPQVDRLDRRFALTAKAQRQREAMIASAPRVDLGFDRRRRGRQDDRYVGEMRAHHRHVA